MTAFTILILTTTHNVIVLHAVYIVNIVIILAQIVVATELA